ncbi:MAG: hypothetical protein J5897_00985, partial [Candidatus Methanomethylophilus sp.]|nr:hypothetical protein [Methanomethylophilus sp.]
MSIYSGDTATVQLTMPAGFDESSWISDDPNVVSVEGNGPTGTVTATGIGQTEIAVIVGSLFKTTVAVSVSERPVTVDTYTFLLKMDYDSEIADYGHSGLTASDLRSGITLTATGTNAGEALESALNVASIPCHFWTKEDNSIRYWVDDILGLGDVKLDGGLWKYWIQYQVIDGRETYNQMSLGFYTDGGSFILRYGITSEDEKPIRDEIIDIPSPESDLLYNGNIQVGIASSEGYTVVNGSAIDSGKHTATVTLNEGYVWSDGSFATKEIEWEISPAVLTARYAGERIPYGSVPALTVEVTGFIEGENALTLSGYMAPSIPTWTNGEGLFTLTPSGGTAPNYVFVYQSGILEIYKGELDIVSDTTTTGEDGSVTHTIVYEDNSKTETVTKSEDDGTTSTETVTTTNYDKDGNATGSIEKVITETTD